MRKIFWIIAGLGILLLSACTPQTDAEERGEGPPGVVAVNTTLADIAQNIAGERVEIEVLIPAEADPHTFQPTPQDVAKIANSQMLIANGAGLEEWLQEVIDNAGGERIVVEAAADLAGDEDRPGDPHFWLDPNHVIHYANQIRDGLIELDPDGETVYARNTDELIVQIEELDTWINEQVEVIPPELRLLVTNHESFGYFADRYGFVIVGTIIPSVSTGSSPSAQQMVALVEAIKATNTGAIFLEAGSNPDLAEQLASETGIKVIKNLRTQPQYPEEGYIEMMKYNTRAIVEALR
jgi:ABC-type Zn uptake system ZnuABC Zn-binding protein ZnuA